MDFKPQMRFGFFEPKMLTDRKSMDALHRLIKAEEEYLKSMLSREPRHISSKPSHAVLSSVTHVH